jgi:hypothetical protein
MRVGDSHNVPTPPLPLFSGPRYWPNGSMEAGSSTPALASAASGLALSGRPVLVVGFADHVTNERGRPRACP